MYRITYNSPYVSLNSQFKQLKDFKSVITAEMWAKAFIVAAHYHLTGVL